LAAENAARLKSDVADRAGAVDDSDLIAEIIGRAGGGQRTFGS
jgi:hypothetical protein